MTRRAVRAVLAALTLATVAHAGPQDVVTLPTAMAANLQAGTDLGFQALLPRLDHLISEAVQDFGLTLALERKGPRRVLADEELVNRARGAWVVQAAVGREGAGLRLRITAVRPGTRVLLTRSEYSSQEDLEVRVVVMLRDLLQGQTASLPDARPVATGPAGSVQTGEPRSAGRAVLALNAALFGGYVGYAIQAGSGSADPRLVYPLVALGTGVGLGASMLVADEWDVGVGGAWFLSAGLWWPTSAGLLLAADRRVAPQDRYVYGVVAGTGGVALAIAAMSLSDTTDGDAALVHSGAALGLGLGALGQLFVRGTVRATPTGGMGYGAAVGTLGAGLLATQIDVGASSALHVDLGAALGALTGAAAGSPLLLVDRREGKLRTRAWLGGILSGSALGAGLGWWLSQKSETRGSSKLPPALPYAVVMPDAAAHFEVGMLGRF